MRIKMWAENFFHILHYQLTDTGEDSKYSRPLLDVLACIG